MPRPHAPEKGLSVVDTENAICENGFRKRIYFVTVPYAYSLPLTASLSARHWFLSELSFRYPQPRLLLKAGAPVMHDWNAEACLGASAPHSCANAPIGAIGQVHPSRGFASLAAG